MKLFHFWRKFIRNKDPFIYVALGDSTVEGVGASAPHRSYTGILHAAIKEKKKMVTYHNLGIKGATVSDVIRDQLQKAIVLQPDLITISIGANDIRARKRAKTFEKELTSLIKELQTNTNAYIVINTIPDLSLTPAIPRYLKKYCKYMAIRFNNKIKKVSDDLAISFVDLFYYSRSVLIQFPEAIAGDGFHPSDFGYAIWANTMIPQIDKAITR